MWCENVFWFLNDWPGIRKNSNADMFASGPEYEEVEVHLLREKTGFGFRILGGDEAVQAVSPDARDKARMGRAGPHAYLNFTLRLKASLMSRYVCTRWQFQVDLYTNKDASWRTVQRALSLLPNWERFQVTRHPKSYFIVDQLNDFTKENPAANDYHRKRINGCQMQIQNSYCFFIFKHSRPPHLHLHLPHSPSRPCKVFLNT